MRLIKNLLEMGEYEEEADKEYVDEDEARGHAKEFLDRAAQVLNYNKKEGNDDEIEKLAMQYAKDYYEAICDEIKGKKYGGSRDEEEGSDMEGEMADRDTDMASDMGGEDFM